MAADYLSHLTNTKARNKTIRKCCKLIKPYLGEFDNYIGRGVSGIAIASMLALRTHKNITVVRKQNASHHSTHSSYEVECEKDSKRGLIVDDLICSGATIRTIIDCLEANTTIKCVGVLLFCDKVEFIKGKYHTIPMLYKYKTISPIYSPFYTEPIMWEP